MKGILKYAKAYVGRLLVIILSGFGCSIASVYIVDILKQVIDQSVSGSLMAVLPELSGKAVGVILIGMLANYLVVKMTGLFGAGVLRDLRRDLVSHMMKLAPDVMEKHNFGDIMERASADVDALALYMQTYLKDCLYVPVIVVVFAGYLFSMSPLLALVCLGPLLIMVPLSIRLLKPVKIAQAEYVKRLGLTNNHIQEAFDGAEVIHSYNLQRKMLNKYRGALQETFDISAKNDLWQYHIEPLSALIREAPAAIALCLGGWLVLKGELSLGVLVAFISGIEKINEPLVNAYQLVVRTQMAMISAKRVFEIMDMPEEVENGQRAEWEKTSSNVFELENVSFAYEEQEKGKQMILKQLNLSIKEGMKVAFVGPSGSGKSTLMKLLCGQYQVSEGTMRVWGNSVSDITPRMLREQLALISQEAVIFPVNVWDNIRIGKPEAGHEEIVNAAKQAGCHDFIMKLPEGYDTLLKERGNNLSGGQRQRISIARAILKDAPVFLLDEPTSALDGETERYVNETLMEIAKNKTMVTVAHRLNTITNYDEILVLDVGQIVERGTHRMLINAGGKYNEMYKAYE